MNIAEMLRAQAIAHPDTPAIVDTRWGRGRSMTFAELDEASGRAARLLRRSGLRPGDAVLVLQPMSAELYVALSAIFRLGLIAMVLDPSAGRTHVERCCAIRPPAALIAGSKAHLLRLWSPALRRIPRIFAIGLPVPGAVWWHRAAGLTALERVIPCQADTPALLTFTSGSTGEPKVAVRTHGFLLAQYRALERSIGFSPGETSLMSLPVVALANLAAGVTTVIPHGNLRRPETIDPAPIIRQIERHHVTSAAGPPALFERLADHCKRRHIVLSGLEHVYIGGGPVFPRLLEKLQRIAPPAELVSVYGSTEAEPIAHVARSETRPEDLSAMLDGGGLLAGRPVPDIRLGVIRDRWGTPLGPWTEDGFAAERLPACEAGEIVVSGEHVLPGYLDGRGDRETKFLVGGTTWHRTGDAGYLDRGGRLWLLGRCAARIEGDGGTLYPFAIECALSHRPEVRRSALVAHGGRRILAVELERGVARGGLISLQDLAGQGVDEIRLVRRLPVDARHNSKIDYPVLHRLLDRSPSPSTSYGPLWRRFRTG